MPTQQVSNFKLNEKLAWKLSFSVDVPTTSDSAIVFVSRIPISTVILQNKVYRISEYVNSSLKVLVKLPKGTQSFTYKGLEANTSYYFAFISYNNKPGGIFYRTSDPYIIHTPTKGKDYGNYYKSLDTNKAVFLSQLTALLKNHTLADYTEFRNIVSEVYERDTLINDSSKKYVRCEYSDIIATYIPPYSFPGTKMNREHTLPKNWMNFRFSVNDSLTEVAEGADYHNLTPTNEIVNSARSDYAFDNVTSRVKSYGKAKLDTNPTFSLRRFEPQDRYKGNAARCIFYTLLCYNGTMNKIWGLRKDMKSDAQYQSQDLLRTWSKQDTVDNSEIARHECIAAIQGNRNPFIDFPDWVDCVDFNDMIQLKTCQGLYIKDTSTGGGGGDSSANLSHSRSNWDVWYYNYSTDKCILKCYLPAVQTIQVEIFDYTGKKVHQEAFQGNVDENSHWLDISSLSSDVYILKISSKNLLKSMKLIKN